MKTLRYTAIFISIFLFFIWTNHFEIYKPLTLFFPTLHIIFFSMVIVLSLTYKYVITLKFTDINYRPFIFFPIISFILTLLINIFFFKSIPHIQDSIHYISIAQNILEGRLHHPFIQDYEFFGYLYMIHDGEKLFSIFLPGYSFFLIPFVITGTTFLINPILTALNIFLLGKTAQKLFNRQIAALSMLIASVSIFVIIMGGTFMAHPFCATLTLIIVYFYIEALNKKGWKAPVIIGIAIGWLILIRPQNALFLFIPLFLYTTYLSVLKKDTSLISKFSLAAAAFLPFLLILFGINYYYTGDIFVFKQDLFFNPSEPRNFCHRFGIGTGCPDSNWIELPKEGLTWKHAFLVSYRRLSSLSINLFLHPLSFIFIVIAFFKAGKRKELIFLSSLFALFIFNFAGYFFFYFDGNVFGPRYLFETSFFLIIIIAFGIHSTVRIKTNKISEKALNILVAAFLFSTFIFQIFVTAPKLYEAYSFGFWEVDSKLNKVIKEKNIHNAVVFVSPEHLAGSGLAVMNLGDIENNDVLYLRDLGPKQNSRIMFTYSDRSFYMAKFEKVKHNYKPPEITPLKKTRDHGEYHIEMEDKNLPLTGNIDYCNYFPKTKYLDSYLDFKPPYSQIKQYQRFYFCRFTEENQYYDFGQKINYSGRYRLSIKVMKGPRMGNFNLFIDDKPFAELKTNGEKIEKKIITFEINLEKGFRKFRIEPASSFFPYYFFIDYIDFYLLTRENLTIK